MTIIALLPQLIPITQEMTCCQQLILITQEMTIIALLPAIGPDNLRNERLVASH